MSWVGISSSILFPSGLLILDFGRWIFDLGLNIDTILAKQSSRTFFWKIKGKQEKRPSRLLYEYCIYSPAYRLRLPLLHVLFTSAVS